MDERGKSRSSLLTAQKEKGIYVIRNNEGIVAKIRWNIFSSNFKVYDDKDNLIEEIIYNFNFKGWNGPTKLKILLPKTEKNNKRPWNKNKNKKIEFLSLIGVDVENMTYNHININIDKAWKFIKKLAKGRNIEEILRYKVVNSIMSMTEKKASEKARRIYEKLEIYKNYMNKKKEEERKKKQKEEEEKYNELLKSNPKELIRQKMVKSLSQKKIFNKIEKVKKKKIQKITKIKI